MYLIKEGNFEDGPGLVIPALLATGGQVRTVVIDAVGKAHPTEEYMNTAGYTVSPASKWGDRWAGPQGAAYATDRKWRLLGGVGKAVNLSQISIHVGHIRRELDTERMKPPASEEAWRARIHHNTTPVVTTGVTHGLVSYSLLKRSNSLLL